MFIEGTKSGDKIHLVQTLSQREKHHFNHLYTLLGERTKKINDT